MRLKAVFIGNILMHGFRNPDPIDGSKCLKTGSDIYSITKHVSILNNCITQVNAHSKMQPWNMMTGFQYRTCAGDSIGGRNKERQNTITNLLNPCAIKFFNQRFLQQAVSFQQFKGFVLILSHQGSISNVVGKEN